MNELKKLSVGSKYVCIDPATEEKMFDFYHQALEGDELHRFEEHLYLCFKCQKTLSELDGMFQILTENYEQLFSTSGLTNRTIGGRKTSVAGRCKKSSV
jgi:hypothetical protein